MNEEIIVAVYDTEAHADAAVRDLEAAHVPPTAITRHVGGPAASGTPGSSGNPAGQGFWSSLFGGEPDHDTSVYDRSLESGSSVVTVRVPEEHVDRVTEILERYDPHSSLRCRDAGGGECNAAFRARLDRSASRIGRRKSRRCRLHRPHHRGDG